MTHNIDYSKCSISELLDVLEHIDRDKYPEKVDEIEHLLCDQELLKESSSAKTEQLKKPWGLKVFSSKTVFAIYSFFSVIVVFGLVVALESNEITKETFLIYFKVIWGIGALYTMFAPFTKLYQKLFFVFIFIIVIIV